jgi:hypothetical protein
MYLFPVDLLSVGYSVDILCAHKHELFEASATADGKHYIEFDTFCVYSSPNNFLVSRIHTLNMYFMRCNVALHKQQQMASNY